MDTRDKRSSADFGGDATGQSDRLDQSTRPNTAPSAPVGESERTEMSHTTTSPSRSANTMERERAYKESHGSYSQKPQPQPQPQPQPTAPSHALTTVQSTRQNAMRSSAEFNRRFDGPYGRPSLIMARRKSSVKESLDIDQENAERPPVDSGNPDVSTPRVFEPEPPRLNYTLKTKKRIRAAIIFWFFIILDSVFIPIALYFGLWYGVGPGANTPNKKKEILSANAVFSIVTAAVGGASILEYFIRFWRLWKKSSTCRVIGARRSRLRTKNRGTCQYWPPIRLLSMPATTMLFAFGTELLLVDCLRIFHVPALIRMSSIPKGAQLRPCIYTIIEDVVAVDGGGGTEYRVALNRRYEASHVFRTMLRKLGVFWALGAEIMAVVCTILIFTLNEDTAYVIGWSVPFAWAGVWALATLWYVKRELKKEKVSWAEEMSKSTA